MKIIKILTTLCVLAFIWSCGRNAFNPVRHSPPSPFYMTQEPLTIRNIIVPVGSKLTYERYFLKEGKQDKIMNEKKLTAIDFPDGETTIWGGIPIKSIGKFFNPDMTGYSVYPDFKSLSKVERTRFIELLEVCENEIGVTVKSSEDWSFNKNNIVDVDGCGVNYQRYFKDDKKQQAFLDAMYEALMEIEK